VTRLQLGARIRALRHSRSMTLRELADAAGVTESFLSQVEREVASPSIASVQRIAGALGLAFAVLFVEEPVYGRRVGRGERRRIEYPGLGAVDEFLTIGLSGRIQVIISTIAPGGSTGAEAYVHDSDEEVVVVLEGSIELWVGEDHHVLETGDSITYSSRLPHSNANNGIVPAVVLFCVTPPSF
jgi:transcriptional regulator with XRE-family HTH domain